MKAVHPLRPTPIIRPQGASREARPEACPAGRPLAPGGQAGTSSRIENYLGFPSGLSGGDLARRAVTQARRFGVETIESALSGLKRTENEARLVKQYDEVYEFLVLPAFLLLVGEACVNERRRRRARA